MVYVAADNDLERFAYYDLLEIESAKPANADVIVLVDRSRDYFSGWKNWYGAKMYSMTKGRPISSYVDFYVNGEVQKIDDLVSQPMMNVGEIDSSDPRFLQNFISYVASNYKARHYALVAWDHGGGWSAMLADTSGSTPKFMSTEQFASALKQSVSYLPNRKFDLILMDMCLMAQLDFLYDVKDLADYVVASAPNAPGFGSDYKALMELVGGNQGTEEIGRGLIDANTEFYDKSFVQPSSFSLFKTDRTVPVVEALKNLVAQLIRDVDSDYYRQTVNIGLSSHYANQLGYDDQKLGQSAVSSVDIIDWLNRVEKSNKKYEKAVKNLRDRISEFNIYTRSSTSISGTNGLAVYLPVSRGNVKNGYYSTAFARVTGLDGYLQKLYQKQEIGSRTEPSVTNVELGYAVPHPGADLSNPKNFDIRQSDTIIPLTQASLRFDVNGENILWTKMLQLSGSNPDKRSRKRVDFITLLVDLKKQYSIDEKQRQGKSNDIMPDYNNGTTTFLREMTAQRFMVTDLQTLAPATVYHDSLDFEYIYLNGLYYGENIGREIEVTMYFNTNTLTVEKVVDTTGKPVAVQGNGYFKPAVVFLTLDENLKNPKVEIEYGSQVPFSSPDGLILLLSNLEPGEYVSYSVRTETLDHKPAGAMSRAVRVENIQSQIKMNFDSYANVDSIAGTYSVAEYARMSSNETRMMPLFNTMTIKPSRNKGLFDWDIDGKLKGIAIISGVSDPRGLTPIHMLFYTEEELKKGSNIEVMAIYHVFISGKGKYRNISMIRVGTGERMGFYPIDGLTQGDFEGTWIGGDDTLYVHGNSMRIVSVVGKEKNKLILDGTYEITGNRIILKTQNDTYKFAFVLDRVNDRLTMISENMTRIVLDKIAGASGRTYASIRKDLAGEWYEEKTGTSLKITRTDNMPYLRFSFSSAGRNSEAVGAFNDTSLFLTYSAGAKMQVEYSLDGSSLTMDFAKSGKFVFTRKK